MGKIDVTVEIDVMVYICNACMMYAPCFTWLKLHVAYILQLSVSGVGKHVACQSIVIDKIFVLLVCN